MSRTYRTYPFEVRSTGDGGASFEGYCSVFCNIDEYGTIMARGCFDKHLEFFRSRGFLGGLNHNWDNPIGSPTRAEVDATGLLVAGSVLDTGHGLDCRKLLKAGVVKSLSIGFEVLNRTYLEGSEEVAEYWASVGYPPSPEDLRRAAAGAVRFDEVKVYEASPVMAPGNDRADITQVRRDEPDGFRPLESHAVAARAAVEEICDRLERIAALRQRSGRALGPEKVAFLSRLRDRLDGARAACRPRPAPGEVARLRRELIEMETAVLTG